MGAIGPWQIALVLILAVFLFGGRGKISAIMGDFAKGIKAFRTGLEDEEKSIAEDKTVKSTAEMKSAEEEPISKG